MKSNILEEIRAIWRSADAVCFDVDSTVCRDEGIDELAKFCGKGDDVARLTREAMKGSMSFREALAKRLNIINPSLEQVRSFIKQCPPKLTPGIKKLVAMLHSRGVPVYLVSGGFRCIIGPVALELNIPVENIYANRLKFFFNGEYAGFDENELTSNSHGKSEVINLLKAKYNYTRLVHIGDGATDLEACPPADAFIGFGGNVVREEVRVKSKWFVKCFDELIVELKVIDRKGHGAIENGHVVEQNGHALSQNGHSSLQNGHSIEQNGKIVDSIET